MNTVKLNGTDLEVSEVGFGGIPIIPLPKNEAVSIVKHCFDLGITFFDTANMYDTSEEKIGAALGTVRDKVVIASKTTQRDANGAADHIDKRYTFDKTQKGETVRDWHELNKKLSKNVPDNSKSKKKK